MKFTYYRFKAQNVLKSKPKIKFKYRGDFRAKQVHLLEFLEPNDDSKINKRGFFKITLDDDEINLLYSYEAY